MKSFSELEQALGISFSNKKLLEGAFIHRSYLNENPHLGLSHNERLEYLGDAVLELVVTDFLYHQFPDKNEGDLTALRAALVNANTLAQLAGKLCMNDYLRLSHGESKSEGKSRQYILANTFEAFVGALYLDGGIPSVSTFIKIHLMPLIDEIVEKRLWQDAKSHFQECAQEYRSTTPRYEVLNEKGPDHAKIFTVGVFIGEEKIDEGVGASKQEAEQDAAKRGLAKMGWLS